MTVAQRGRRTRTRRRSGGRRLIIAALLLLGGVVQAGAQEEPVYERLRQMVKQDFLSLGALLQTVAEKPFVCQTSLDDFYVSYEVNVYTHEPSTMARIYSELHQNIQDKFNEAGVEIMSPHYSALRDGNQVTVPTDYLPKSYQAPAFGIRAIGDAVKAPFTQKVGVPEGA